MYPSKAADTYDPPPPPPPTTGIPATFQVQSQAPIAPWSTGLCDCCDDIGNCCITFFCPCITFGQIAEIIDRGSTSCGLSGAVYTLIMFVTGCQCLYSCFYRRKLRAQYGLKDEPCPDCLVHYCFCELCSLCQMHRELQRRGFDMNIGWQANMERRGQMATLPPPVQDMSR